MGNCLIGLIYLIIIGKIHKVVCISTTTKWWPAHYIGITKKGHALHYSHALDHKYNTYAPFWYIGKFVGISKDRLNEELKKSGRYVIQELEHVKIFAFVGSIVVGLFVLPVGMYMAFYPFFSFGKDIFKLLFKLIFRKRTINK